MFATLALALAPLAFGLSAPADRDEPNHTRLSLVAEKNGVEPGGTITLAAIFDIEKDWHIYWDGQNDTGQPPKFGTAAWPAAVKLGEIGWPVPTRHPLPGDMIDHIYEKQAVVLLPLTIAKDAKPGTTLSIEIPVEWMECAGVCRIGSATVKAEIRVMDKAADLKDAAGAPTIAAARRAMPTLLAKDSPVSVVVNASELTITAKGADRIVWMPHRASAELADLAGLGEAKGDALRAALKPRKDKAAAESPIVGIVATQRGKTMTYYWVDTSAKTEKAVEPDPKPKSGDGAKGTSPAR
jgi:DsbC/DsbD-like thiol-disulfide interchange protein